MNYPIGEGERAGEGRTILLVDDDPIQRKLGRIYLEQLGFRVVLAEDGQDALEKAQISPPDAIVSDMLMPRLDGFKLCLKVRQDAALADVPVVLTSSAFVEEADRRLAESVGASAFIPRTPDMNEVIDCLFRCLNGSAPRDTLPAHLPTEEYAERVSDQLGQQVKALARVVSDLRESERRMAFLSGAGVALAESLDYEATLGVMVHLAVPDLADWCCIHVLASDGSVQCLAEAHADEDKGEIAGALLENYPPLVGETFGIARVLSSGKAVLCSEINRVALGVAARDEAHLELLTKAGIVSAMIVPLVARGRVLATATFAAGGSRPSYGEEDLALAEEFARRCALALDNARLYEEARKAVRVREDFLSIAAHELKTPLTTLRGFAQITLKRMAKEQAFDLAALRRAMEMVDLQSVKLACLVNQLLDVCRLDQGRLCLDLRPVDLVRLAGEAVSQALARSDRNGIALRAPDELVWTVDPLRIEQVLSNLLDNAIKFSPEGGAIELELCMGEEGEARIALRDHGLGIPEASRPFIFDRLYQDRSGHLGGLGLGLFISREIVSMHGGKIWFECPEDGGSRFVLTLPTGAE